MEDKIQAARRGYNSAVKHLYNLKEQFPSSIVYGFMKIEDYAMFEISDKEKENIDISSFMA